MNRRIIILFWRPDKGIIRVFLSSTAVKKSKGNPLTGGIPQMYGVENFANIAFYLKNSTR